MARKINPVTSMAAALAVALAPVPADSIGNHDLPVSRYQTSTLSFQNVKDSLVFLPLSEATDYMLAFAERMREQAGRLRGEWEERRDPIKVERHKKSTQEGVARIRQYVEICASLIDAVREALNNLPDHEVELRQDIVSFGRSVAQVRYSLEDTFNFIESTKRPKKVSEALPDVNADDVHALIRSEHKKLGLKEPKFH